MEELKKDIEHKIQDLLEEFGPDGHIDGYKQITEYVLNLLIIHNEMMMTQIKEMVIKHEDNTSRFWKSDGNSHGVGPTFEKERIMGFNTAIGEVLDLHEKYKLSLLTKEVK
jgi:hypothetical protein